MEQWEAHDNSCRFTTKVIEDIQPGEELYVYYGEDYFEDLEGGCPCKSCNRDAYEALEVEKEQHRVQQCQKEEDDKAIIADKKKERKKKRRDKQKGKSNDT